MAEPIPRNELFRLLGPLGIRAIRSSTGFCPSVSSVLTMNGFTIEPRRTCHASFHRNDTKVTLEIRPRACPINGGLTTPAELRPRRSHDLTPSWGPERDDQGFRASKGTAAPAESQCGSSQPRPRTPPRRDEPTSIQERPVGAGVKERKKPRSEERGFSCKIPAMTYFRTGGHYHRP